MLIAIIYAVTGAVGVVNYYTRSQAFAACGPRPPRAGVTKSRRCLMETIIAFGTTLLALYLANASNWTLFNEKVRTFISDYV